MGNAQGKIEQVRESLIRHDVEFKEFANGHFRVFKDGCPVLDFWATTAKYKLAGDSTFRVGEHKIKEYILGTIQGKIASQAAIQTPHPGTPEKSLVDNLQVDEIDWNV